MLSGKGIEGNRSGGFMPKQHALVKPELNPLKIFSQRLAISVSTARQMVAREEVDVVRIGAKILIPEAEIKRIIQEGLQPRKVKRLWRDGKPVPQEVALAGG
jgi:hypothetical protein